MKPEDACNLTEIGYTVFESVTGRFVAYYGSGHVYVFRRIDAPLDHDPACPGLVGWKLRTGESVNDMLCQFEEREGAEV